jgi:hypothetical protein
MSSTKCRKTHRIWLHITWVIRHQTCSQTFGTPHRRRTPDNLTWVARHRWRRDGLQLNLTIGPKSTKPPFALIIRESMSYGASTGSLYNCNLNIKEKGPQNVCLFQFERIATQELHLRFNAWMTLLTTSLSFWVITSLSIKLQVVWGKWNLLHLARSDKRRVNLK